MSDLTEFFPLPAKEIQQSLVQYMLLPHPISKGSSRKWLAKKASNNLPILLKKNLENVRFTSNILRPKFVWVIFLFLVLRREVYGQSNAQGVPEIWIDYNFNYPSVYPKEWLEPPISMNAIGLDSLEEARCKRLFERFLTQYPPAFVNFHARRFAFFSYFELHAKPMSYLVKGDWIMIMNRGARNGVTDEWIESALHFSFAHHLWTHYGDSALAKPFMALLPRGFTYTGYAFIGDRDAGDNFDLEPRLHEFGFATLDGAYTFERDFFGIAAQLWMNREAFRKAVFANPRLMQKTKLVVDFFTRFDPDMNLAWFLNRSPRHGK